MRRVAAVIGGAVAMVLFVAAVPASAQQNYPLEITLELRDRNGRLIDAFNSVCPAEGVSVHSTGWLRNSFVRASFHSDPVDLGDHPADGQGVVDFTFRIADVENGIHTLRLAGTGANGQARTVEASMLCECPQPASPRPVAVAGATLDASSGTSGSGFGGLAFGKTGSDAALLAAIALDLVAVGLALRLAVRRRQRTAS